ncbi:hypothetical protein NC652_028000 [Populus alba x Populus x berolinensis]|nr:hypothetical protein NC652_028000 [Populus alba x Populus x berolinensis]
MMLTTSGVLRALLSTLKSHIFYVIHIATLKHEMLQILLHPVRGEHGLLSDEGANMLLGIASYYFIRFIVAMQDPGT